MSQDKKLTAIYAALDNGNFSEAVRLCQKPGTSSHPLAQALLSYALAAMKKHDEALSTAKSVLELFGTDESIVSTVAHTYKLCHAYEESVKMYERIITFNPPPSPAHESFSQELFFTLVRMGDFKKMQLLAQKLFKSTDNQVYVFWTVSCMLLQGADLPATMLVVAEKMIRKVYFEPPVAKSVNQISYHTTLPSSEDLTLSLEVFKRQGKEEQALILLDSLLQRERGDMLTSNSDFETFGGAKIKPTRLELLSTRFDLLKTIAFKSPGSRQYRDLLIRNIQEILIEFPDQWSAYEAYIELIIAESTDQNNQSDIFFEDVLNSFRFIRSIKVVNIRGPKLALLKLCVTIKNSNWFQRFVIYLENFENSAAIADAFDLINSPNKILCDFVKTFSIKQCCFSDIKDYLNTSFFNSSEIAPFEELARFEFSNLVAEIRALFKVFNDQIMTDSHVDDKSKAKEKPKSKKNKSQPNTSKVSTLPHDNLIAFINSNVTDRKESLRSQASNLSCKLSTFGKILFHLNFVFRKTRSIGALTVLKFSEVLEIVSACQQMTSGGIGGLREVQPSDDLLMLISATYRVNLQSALNITCKEMFSFNMNCKWLAALKQSTTCSPYAYCFNVEALEPCRFLLASSSAKEYFAKLGAKHVQFDTLSYLALPVLIEGGLFADSLALYQSIEAFHLNAKRETLEQMHRCFKSGSYSKALELKRFVDICQSSTQLALARSEGIFIDVLVNNHTPSEALEMFDRRLANIKNLNQEDQFVDTMDYGLIVRVDSIRETELLEKSMFRDAYISRIKKCHTQNVLLRCALSGESLCALREYIDRLSCDSTIDAEFLIPTITEETTTDKLFNPRDQDLWGRLSPNKTKLFKIANNCFWNLCLSLDDGSVEHIVSDWALKWRTALFMIKDLLYVQQWFEPAPALKIMFFSCFVFDVVSIASLVFQCPRFVAIPIMRAEAVEFLSVIDGSRRHLISEIQLLRNILGNFPGKGQELKDSIFVDDINTEEQLISDGSPEILNKLWNDYSASLESIRMMLDKRVNALSEALK